MDPATHGTTADETVRALIARSNALGSDPRITNYAGGNTSAKGTATDPVTGEPVELLWVKGSGGDLGTLTPSGLAVLRVDRVRALRHVYPASSARTRWSPRSTTPCSARAARHRRSTPRCTPSSTPRTWTTCTPDAGIAIATAADGPALTERVFGDRVVWVPWRRPGFQLGLDIAAIKEQHPEAIGTVLGGHGITAWGSSSEEAEANSRWIIDTAEQYIREHGRDDPFGAVRPGFEALPETERRARAAALAPTVRGIAGHDKPVVGHFTDSDVVLDFLASAAAPRLADLGTSCPDHFLRTKVKPLLLDLPATASVEEQRTRLHELHDAYRADYQAYYDRHADADSPAIRGADPLVVLVPGVGMFSYGRDAQTARVAGEFYVNAINVMRGAEALSTYAPIDEAEKFRIEYWALEEAKLRRMPAPKQLATRIALVTGAASGIGKAIAKAPRRRGCRRRHRRPRPRQGAGGRRRDRRPGPGHRRRRERDRRRRDRPGDPGDAAALRRPRPRRQQRRAVAEQEACSRPPSRTGTCSTTSWRRARSSCRRPRRRSSSSRASAVTSCTSPRRTPSSPVRTTSPTPRRRRTRRTRSGCSRPSSASTGSA